MPLRFANLFRVGPPTVEPVSVAEAKAQLRILHSDDDADLGFLLQVAREWAEDYSNLSLTYQTWLANFVGWPTDGVFLLPRPPLSVVQNLRYRDEGDDWVDLSEEDDYTVDELEGTITMMSQFSSPVLSLSRHTPIEVVFRAGFGDAATDVPLRVRQAIRLFVSSQYGIDRGNDRSKVSFRAPNVAEMLLNNFRVRPL